MGLFTKVIACPNCGAPDAEKSLFSVACTSLGCVHYSQSLALSRSKKVPASNAAPKQSQIQKRFEVNLSDHQAHVRIQYNNARNEQKVFDGDARTLRGRGEFISLCVLPKKRRISLRKTKISSVTGNDQRVVGVLQNMLSEKGRLNLGDMVKRFEGIR